MVVEMAGDTRTGGRWLRALRESQGLTQRELEKRTGVSYATISQLEIGSVAKPGMETLVMLGEALGFDANTAAERFGYASVPVQEAEAVEITHLKHALKRASVGQRYGTLMAVDALATSLDRQIAEG